MISKTLLTLIETIKYILTREYHVTKLPYALYESELDCSHSDNMNKLLLSFS